MARLLREGAGITTLRAEMVQISILTSQLPPTARVRTGIEVLARNNKFHDAKRTGNKPEKTVDPFIITYGANRHMGHQNVGKSPESGSVDLLQTDDTELIDATEVLSNLDYSAYKERPKARAQLEKMKHALAEILPFVVLLARCGIACVPHGFRSSFRDWAAEETDHPREVVEAALAHRVQNPVEAAYARSDLFERRRRLMDDWAAYLTGERRPEESSPR